MARLYKQHCALAHALDLVGDRWTLLIVRELLPGPLRYSDLMEGLVTAPTNLLAKRLKAMTSMGLVTQRRLPRPANSVTVYELTDLGASLGGSVVELARWGMGTLPATREGRSFQSHWLVLALDARFEPGAAVGVTESYEFRIDADDVVHFKVAGGDGAAYIGAALSPAVVVTADVDTFLELTAEAITPPEAINRGACIEGDPAAILRMRSILPPPARHSTEIQDKAGGLI